MDDWASDEGGELGELGELDLPEVELPPEPEPKPLPTPVVPAVNAWTQPRSRGDARALLRSSPGPAQAAAAAAAPGSATVTTPAQAPRVAQVPRAAQVPRGAAPQGGPPGRRNINTGYTRRDDRGPPSSRGGGVGGGGGQGRGVVLYVSNLPSRADANEIGDMFADCGVADVRLTHHSDTGNVKAAFVTLGAGVDPGRALSVDGRHLGGRPMHVKIDGTDRRGGGGGGSRERAPYGSGGFGPNGASGGGGGGGGYGGSYGGSYGGRRSGSNGDGSGGVWGGSSYEPAGGNRDRGSRDREHRQQQFDPTIPTGPPAAGRKKLQLKPRTKPAPTLEIDHRAIGDTRKSRSGGAPSFNRGGSRGDARMQRHGSQGSQGSQVSQDSNKGTLSDSDKQFTTVKSGSTWDQGKTAKEVSNLSSKMASTKLGDKSDDAPKPALKNTFALLGEDDE